MDIEVGDVVRLRKKHPCGGDEWKVVKLGVDIRIKCLKCQRLVLLERGILEHRIKTLGLETRPVDNSIIDDNS
jgi:hypothetical protein